MVLALLVGGALSGCATPGHVNHAPVAKLIPLSPLSGPAPLPAYLRIEAYDPDGDALTIVNAANGIPTTFTTGPTPPNYLHVDYDNTSFNYGTWNFVLTVSDGSLTTNDTVTFTVVGEPYFDFVMAANATVSQTCSPCSGGVPPYVGTVRTLGAAACRGFDTTNNQTDCAWFEIKPEWEGLVFEVNATNGADADAEMRTSCSLDGTALAYYVNSGIERSKVPSGARCLIVWTYYAAPASLRARIYA